jgi:hypothetical protein
MSDTQKGLDGQLPTAHIPGTTNDAQPTHRLETGLATAFPWETDSAPRQKPPVARAEDSDYSDAAASPTGRHDRLMSKRKSQPKVQEAGAGETHQETTLSRIAKYPLEGTQAGGSASAPARQHSRSSSVSSRNSRGDDRFEVLMHSVHSMAQAMERQNLTIERQNELISAHFARPISTQSPGVSLIHPRTDQHLSPARSEHFATSVPVRDPFQPTAQFVPPDRPTWFIRTCRNVIASRCKPELSLDRVADKSTQQNLRIPAVRAPKVHCDHGGDADRQVLELRIARR